MGKPTITCETHGLQDETWVCQHIVAGLENRKRVGFFWTTEPPENPRPDAYCHACNERVKLTNGEWIGAALEHLEPKCLCGGCYDLAKKFHSGENPWS